MVQLKTNGTIKNKWYKLRKNGTNKKKMVQIKNKWYKLKNKWYKLKNKWYKLKTNGTN